MIVIIDLFVGSLCSNLTLLCVCVCVSFPPQYKASKEGTVMGVAVSKISMLTHCQALTQACNYCEGQSSVLYVTYTSPAFLSLLLANSLCVFKSEILKLYEPRIKNKHDENLKALQQHVSMAACPIISRSLLLKAGHLRED